MGDNSSEEEEHKEDKQAMTTILKMFNLQEKNRHMYIDKNNLNVAYIVVEGNTTYTPNNGATAY